uniref:Ig-like domain-containing protein n=1 Tax=Cyprinus carpio TaxID=7962 RepID=A0A8C1LU67_CYPCA
MFRWSLISLCFTAHYYVSSGQFSVEQSSREIPANEGAQVIVMCTYTTSGTPDLFWYKYFPNRSPTLILSQYTTEPDFKKRFSATLNSTSRTFPLMPTVTETHSTLKVQILMLFNSLVLCKMNVINFMRSKVL